MGADDNIDGKFIFQIHLDNTFAVEKCIRSVCIESVACEFARVNEASTKYRIEAWKLVFLLSNPPFAECGHSCIRCVFFSFAFFPIANRFFNDFIKWL